MARSFRDRFFTPPVARAMTSPLGIVLAGVGAAVGLATGLGIPGAIGLAAVAWGGRVAAAVPRGDKRSDAHRPVRRSPSPGAGTCRARSPRRPASSARSRPRLTARCSVRLADIGTRLERGVDEVWLVASRGDDIDAGLATLDVREAQAELAAARPRARRLAHRRHPRRAGRPGGDGRPHAGRVDGCPRPAAAARRPPGRAGGPGGRAVGQRQRSAPSRDSVTTSTRLVSEMESLRQALEEADQAGGGEVRPARRRRGRARDRTSRGARAAASWPPTSRSPSARCVSRLTGLARVIVLRRRHRPERAGRRLRRGQQLAQLHLRAAHRRRAVGHARPAVHGAVGGRRTRRPRARS